MKFLVVEGTVREGRKSIQVARETVEKLEERGQEAELFDIAEKDIPLLETRRYTEGEVPEDVEEYGRKVEDADCLVIVTPEYNHSIPGALKNLIDYLYPEYDDKPFAYVTVSAGGFGGVHALEDLESLTVTLGGIPGPSLPVSKVGEVFNEGGDLVDEDYEKRFSDFADKAVEHAEKFNF